jgi:hypothetical protein
MSFNNTYVFNQLIALDFSLAALLFNTTDLCVSSLCRLQQLARAKALTSAQAASFQRLSSWQVLVLRGLAVCLDTLQAGHCENSLASDIARAQRVLLLRA